MTKAQEIMEFLTAKVFEPILNNPNTPGKIRSGVHLTIARMNKMTADKMIDYYWKTLRTKNSIEFSKNLKEEKLPRFEDVLEEFREKFNDEWLRK